jgi:hypothetical protein
MAEQGETDNGVTKQDEIGGSQHSHFFCQTGGK